MKDERWTAPAGPRPAPTSAPLVMRLSLEPWRYAGLRVDSEPPRLRWDDHVQLEGRRLLVPCKKTEKHAGKRFRIVPIDSRLLPHLALRYRLRPADEDRVSVLGRLTGSHKATVERAIKRAGVKPWPKLFQALRASYDSELRASGVPTDFASKMTGSQRGSQPAALHRHPGGNAAAGDGLVLALAGPGGGAESGAPWRRIERNERERRRKGNGKTADLSHIPALAGAAWNGGEMGDEGLEPPTSRV